MYSGSNKTYGWHGNGYTLNRPYRKDGTPSFYMTIVNILWLFGPMSKAQIMTTLGRRNDRGYLSATFSALTHSGLISYNRSTKKYEPCLFVEPKFARREIM